MFIALLKNYNKKIMPGLGPGLAQAHLGPAQAQPMQDWIGF